MRVGGAPHLHRVEKVRTATEHSGAPLRPGTDHVSTSDQVFDVARLDVRQPYTGTGRRRDVGHLVDAARIELEVVQRCDRAYATAQARVTRDVGDPLSVDPDLPIVVEAV